MTASARPPVDQAARELIRTDTAATLFVNAGAGSGKTSSLVARVGSLVLADGVRLGKIAAVTFTEKAGAELRDRLRAEFEKVYRTPGPARERAAEALEDLDSAAIGTLHAFAQRLLTEHPIEAGLPPMIEVLDEVGSSVAFDERWAELQAELLDDDALAEPLLLALALGMQLKHVRSLAVVLGKDWDLIGERVLAGPEPQVHLPDIDAFAGRVRAYLQVRDLCTDPDNRFYAKLCQLADLLARVDGVADVGARLAVLAEIAELRYGVGSAAAWGGRARIEELWEDGRRLSAEAAGMVAAVKDQCLRLLTRWVGRRVLAAADARRREGRLEFHDLLVLTRDLLRRDAAVRAAVHADYERVLLDEFQDTDPIQIELAARICAGAPATAERWADIAVPDGRLFVVGDAKQSIYRFRRASIATYLEAQQHIGRPVPLTTNFRTVAPILDWINAVFGRLISYSPGGQPAYVPLDAHRLEAGTGPTVLVLGATAHEDLPKADVLREREATDVAAVIRQILDEGWTVYDETARQWRPACRDDIAVLVPARTSLPFLEDALDAAGVPYRAEASSLVYQAAEVRALLAAARAIADATDELSLVTALRSPLFGCGDDDLWAWKRAGGRFSIRADPPEDSEIAAGPVGAAVGYLRRLSFEARWLAPSEVLARLVTDRRMYEVAATQRRARDSWRRLRFVVDQARAWSEASPGGLRAYLAWAAHQGQEVTRVAEAVLPETDADAVRVMTIHAAKGLEFPIVIMSGMTSQPYRGSGVTLLWPPAGGYEVKLAKAVQTGDFEVAIPVDEQMDDLERLRLLYVAATRARDHLVVSLHHSTRNAATGARVLVGAGAATAADAVGFSGYDFSPVPDAEPAVAPPPPYADWLARVTAARESARAVAAISASGLEGTEPDADLDPAKAKGPRDLELPPWSKGRYGSAIGRAVHGVLQVVDLTSAAGVDAAVLAQCVAEGVIGQEQLVRALVDAALAAPLVQRAAAREHWRETYVGTVRADGVVAEGYVDLVFREDDGRLVIVDYKTDAVPAGAVESRVRYYTPQLDAYRAALSDATGAGVATTLLFLTPEAAFEVPVHS